MRLPSKSFKRLLWWRYWHDSIVSQQPTPLNNSRRWWIHIAVLKFSRHKSKEAASCFSGSRIIDSAPCLRTHRVHTHTLTVDAHRNGTEGTAVGSMDANRNRVEECRHTAILGQTRWSHVSLFYIMWDCTLLCSALWVDWRYYSPVSCTSVEDENDTRAHRSRVCTGMAVWCVMSSMFVVVCQLRKPVQPTPSAECTTT